METLFEELREEAGNVLGVDSEKNLMINSRPHFTGELELGLGEVKTKTKKVGLLGKPVVFKTNSFDSIVFFDRKDLYIRSEKMEPLVLRLFKNHPKVGNVYTTW